MRAVRERWWAVALVLLALTIRGLAAEKLPPKPDAYFNDYAGVVDAGTVRALEERLQQFERDTSNQIVVAVFHKMESDSSIADFTVRVAESWKVGQKGKDNGAVLFVFIDDRKMFIQVGYGLEGALPDATCKRIVEDEIKPHFRTADYAGGIAAGVDAMMRATRGEYQGTGRTQPPWWFKIGAGNALFFIVFGIMLVVHFIRAATGTLYTGRGRRRTGSTWFGGGYSDGGSSWGSGGGSSGGGSSGGGGFSGGGGSFGGGGAGGSW